jgi:ketosteroid isomerase-like protein
MERALREKSDTGNVAVSTKEPLMSRTEPANMRAILEIFSAIERSDLQRLLELCHADVEFHWPPFLPYGGTSRGLKTEPPSWGHTWIPRQPTDAERTMDPRIVAASSDDVVVLWRQRGISPGVIVSIALCSGSTRSATASSRAPGCFISIRPRWPTFSRPRRVVRPRAEGGLSCA